MPSLTASIVSLVAVAPLVSASAKPNVLNKDVVIVGGGASGAYAAVRIRDDFGKSIALVEKEGIIVGLTFFPNPSSPRTP